jgi:hypothetical protein
MNHLTLVGDKFVFSDSVHNDFDVVDFGGPRRRQISVSVICKRLRDVALQCCMPDFSWENCFTLDEGDCIAGNDEIACLDVQFICTPASMLMELHHLR